MQTSLYEILGVDKGADERAIKRAFHALAKKLHPDATGGESDQAFKDLSHAYNVLMNPVTRKAYDETGDRGEKSAERMQLDMISMIAQVLDQVAADPAVQVSEIQFIKGMQHTFGGAMMEYRKDIEKAEKELGVYMRLLGKIKRKDEAKNLFAEICERKIKEYEEWLERYRYELRLTTMILDELQHYTELGEIVRHFQAGHYYSSGTTSSTEDGTIFISSIFKY